MRSPPPAYRQKLGGLDWKMTPVKLHMINIFTQHIEPYEKQLNCTVSHHESLQITLTRYSFFLRITTEPMVRFGWNFACTNICTFFGLSQIFEALPGFFSHTVSKKSLVEVQKFWKFSRLVQILAHAKFQPNRTTLLLLALNQRDLR